MVDVARNPTPRREEQQLTKSPLGGNQAPHASEPRTELPPVPQKFLIGQLGWPPRLLWELWVGPPSCPPQTHNRLPVGQFLIVSLKLRELPKNTVSFQFPFSFLSVSCQFPISFLSVSFLLPFDAMSCSRRAGRAVLGALGKVLAKAQKVRPRRQAAAHRSG